MADCSDVASRLADLAEELGQLALDRLYEAAAETRRTGSADPRVLAEEKLLTRARRSVEKAVHLLESVPSSDEYGA